MSAQGEKEYQEFLKTIVDHDNDTEKRWRSTTEMKYVNKPPELQAWREFKWRYFCIIWVLVSLYISLKFDSFFLGYGSESVYVWLIVFPIILLLLVFPLFGLYIWMRSLTMLSDTRANPKDVEQFIQFTDPTAKEIFGGSGLNQKASMEKLHEAYFANRIDIKGDMLEAMENSHKFAHFQLNYDLIKFFLTNFVPELLIHSRSQDRAQVQDHYNRGNDFFRCFLGPMMIYTSAVFDNPAETLEDAQTRKLNLVCKKLHLKPGMQHLDLGCGWGTLIAHASRFYGTQSSGVTLAKEQVEWGRAQLAREPYASKPKEASAQFFICDYRDRDVYAPNGKKFNAISALEMSEHVGVKLFNSFLLQVYDMLEDDGLFYMQYCGLRRSWQFHDLVWGLFMDKYIFPGADASTPICVVTGELEKAGFEIHSIEAVGVHYSITIYKWYLNWKENEKYIKEKYGEKWWRIWYMFLGWSLIVGRVGRSNCYQIVAHKNNSEFDRSRYLGEQESRRFFENPTKTPC